jgi:small ubiquitin-related modifier
MEGQSKVEPQQQQQEEAAALPLALITQIQIRVINQEGQEVHFKIAPATALKKLMDAYQSRTGLPANSVRFLFDGERVKDTDTPDTLGMQEGDTIDAVLAQTGGSKFK